MALDYKTRGMFSPQGKPRVYFSCHPDDFDLYFETITDDILKKQNCAIWYSKDNKSVFNDEQKLELSQMQLIVLPVTTKLLTTYNRTLNVEFPFAIKNHIPVLPLMQETGLDDLFNAKCGSLQCLNKNIKDRTAISYDEKLEKFLASVLVGDEMIANVRDAFEARLFLSYRKKDRRYALELMKFIHNNDLFRNVAIWYDEFLNVGKNYHREIEDEVKKCELMTLVVTSNLVNEKNYVMDVEYPIALKFNKPVIPIEMFPTNKDQLKNKFPNIPNCIDKNQEREIINKLWFELSKLGIQFNKSNPQKDYYIGLAYLSGIDVEVNRDMGFNLIKNAANNDNPSAIEKIVDIYHSGIGVKQDLEEAIRWQRKLIEIRKKEYNLKQTEEAGYDYEYSLWNLSIYINYLGQLDEEYEVNLQLEEICDELLKKYNSIKALRDIIVARQKLGTIHQKKGELGIAKEYFEKSIKMQHKLIEETECDFFEQDLPRHYSSLGMLCMDEGKVNEAFEYLKKGLEIALGLVEKQMTKDARSTLALSYKLLGDAYHKNEQLDEAKECYQKCIDIRHQLAIESDDASAYLFLAKVYVDMAIVYITEESFNNSKEYCTKAIEIISRMKEKNDSIELRRELSRSYEALSVAYHHLNKIDDEVLILQKTTEIAEKIMNETKGELDTYNYATYCTKLGDLYRSLGDNKALEYLMKAHKLFEELVTETHSIMIRRLLGISYNNLGNYYEFINKIDLAENQYLDSLECRFKLVKEFNNGIDWKLLIDIYIKLGEFYYNCSRFEDALKFYNKAVIDGTNYMNEKSTTSIKRRVLEASYALGVLYERMEDYKNSCCSYKQSMKIATELENETNYINDKYSIAQIYQKLGELYKHAKLPIKAKDYLIKCAMLYEQIFEHVNSLEVLKKLSVVYELLGDILNKEGKKSDAKVYYIKCNDIRSKLAALDSNTDYRKPIAAIKARLGNIYKSEHNLSEARKCIKFALEFFSKLVEIDNSADNLNDLAILYFNMGCVDEKHLDSELIKKSYNIWKRLSKEHPNCVNYINSRDYAYKKWLRSILPF